MVVAQRARRRSGAIEPERKLGLNGPPEVIIPGGGIGITCRIQVDIDLAARACGGAINDLAWKFGVSPLCGCLGMPIALYEPEFCQVEYIACEFTTNRSVLNVAACQLRFGFL